MVRICRARPTPDRACRRGPVMPLGVPEVLRRQMAAALLPYTASTSVAVATELGIHAEAALRALANRAGAGPGTRGRRGPFGVAGERPPLRIVGEGGRRPDDTRGRTPAQRPMVHWHDGGAGPRCCCSTDGARAARSGPFWLARLEECYRVIRSIIGALGGPVPRPIRSPSPTWPTMLVMYCGRAGLIAQRFWACPWAE